MAHRGLSAQTYESTIGAYKLAIERGVLALECDVRLTSDGKLLVVHDDSLRRTTGLNVKPGELTLAEATAIPANKDPRWQGRRPVRARDFSPADDNLASLETLLELVGQRGANLKVELKEPGPKSGQALVKLLAEMGTRIDRSQVTVFARSTAQLAQVATAELRAFGDRELTYTYLMAGAAARSLQQPAVRQAVLDAAQDSQHSLAVPHGPHIDGPFFSQAEVAGVDVWVWTIDSRAEMLRLAALGAAGIISNRPDIFGLGGGS